MRTLVELAHIAGASDNITIILADVVEDTPVALTGGSEEGTGDPGSVRTTAEPDEETDGRGEELTQLLDDTIQDTLPVPYSMSGLIGAAADPRIISTLDRLLDQDSENTIQAPHPQATKLTSADQERHRYTPRTKKSHKGLILIIAAVLVVLGGAGWGVYSYVSSQFFVGAADGRVAIYQGLPGTIAGIDTSKVYETTTINLTDLPLSWRDKVNATIPTSGLDQARASVQEIRAKAQQCRTERANRPPGSGPSPDGC